MLIRKKLTAGEFSSPYLRYDETCDCVQFTPDGGETWIDQPSNDPRTSEAYRLPPLTGDDTRCRAAEGMTALIRAAVDQRLETDTAIEFAGGILGIVVFIPGFNVLWALILALASFAVTIAREILEAAWTESDYDQLRCIYYCNIDEDGQMSQEQFDAAYADLIDMNSIARSWAQNVMRTVGCVGMSDAGVALEAAADCDECGCGWGYEWDFLGTDGGWTFPAGTVGSWVDGSGWHVQDFGSPVNEQALLIETVFPSCEVEVFQTEISSTGATSGITLGRRTGGSYVGFVTNSGGASIVTNPYTYEFVDHQAFAASQNVYCNIDNTSGGSGLSDAYLRKIRIYGNGNYPGGFTGGVEIPPL